MYGTRFTSQICNPYTGAPSEVQITVQTKIKTATAAVKSLTPQQRAAYLAQFKAQKKYRSFPGFLMAQELAKLS